jgi:benzoyl-CoA reductase/2-hydroxyglutaryl-CoA dehydratase subunit BcrC/BadD/HgdB
MSQRLAGLGANIVAATYTACMGTVEGGQPIRYTGGDPLDHLARIQNFSVCPYGLALREQAMAGLVERFAVDGVVFASNRSCKVYSVMQLDLERRITARCRVPTARIDIDHADPRAYDEEQAFTRLEALLETIAAGRQRS